MTQVKERPKSMLAAKSFEPISDMAAVERWVMILAEELAERMVADNKLFNRRPKSLHLHYRWDRKLLFVLLLFLCTELQQGL